MAKANRKQALQGINTKQGIINIEEWGGEVAIRALTFGESLRMANLEQELMEGSEKAQSELSKLLIKKIVDVETGERLFSNADLELISEDNTGATPKVLNELIRLTGVNERGEIEKN